MNKRGILGLDTVKSVLLVLMVIAIMVIASFVVLVNLQSSVDNADVSTGSIINESVTQTELVSGFLDANSNRNCVASISQVNNGTFVINSGNYTITGCTLRNTTNTYSTSSWNVTYSYTYDRPYTTAVVNNITTGSTNFFSQVPTIFVLLGVVVLILIIAVVIVAVSRFGQREESM